MTTKIQKAIPEPVAALGVRIEEWRRDKGKGHKMPMKLWEGAVRLAKRHGVSLVASSLALSYTSLKQKAHGNWGPVKKKSTALGFVDITTPAISATSMMSSLNEIELHRPDGHKVVIRNTDSACVSEVARAFFNQGR